MFKFILGIPIIVHGVAHISGFLVSFFTNDPGYKVKPWIFSSEVYMKSRIGKVFGLFWLVALLAFVSAGLALVFRQSWWPEMALTGALISLVVNVVWWRAVPLGAKIGAVFNLAILIALLTPIREVISDFVAR